MKDDAIEGSKPISDEDKRWIDDASYMAMLKKNRFAPVGDPIFLGKTGEYFFKVMYEKKALLKPGEQADISKLIGWER